MHRQYRQHKTCTCLVLRLALLRLVLPFATARHRGALAQQSWCKCSLYSGNDFRLCRPFIDELKRAAFLLRPLQGLRRSMGEQFSEERKASKLRASWRAKERIASSLRALPTRRSRARGCDSVQLVKNKLLEPCALCLLKIVVRACLCMRRRPAQCGAAAIFCNRRHTLYKMSARARLG